MRNEISHTSRSVDTPANLDRVPALLQSIPQWICWRAGEVKPTGKFDKYPADPTTGRKHDAFDRGIWLSFEDACRIAEAQNYSGVGIVLTGEPVSHAKDGAPLYLIGLDIDAKSALIEGDCTGVKEVWLKLGKPYLEVSPSGTGFRMFALSRIKLTNGNECGNELYADKRFLTVTGNIGKGQLKDCTDPLVALHAEWFTKKKAAPPVAPPAPSMFDHLLQMPPPPESPEQVAKVRDMLSHLRADCEYPDWRDLIWAIEATGWNCAEELGREWSMTAPHRFDEDAFQQVRHSYKAGGIGFGTLVFKAKQAGWEEARKLPDAPTTTPARFTLLTRAGLIAQPHVRWVVHGVLPAKGLASIYGPSTSGKSFLALDVLIAIAEGSRWFGFKVKQTPVVYCVLEGTAGIKQRVDAWESKHGRQIPANFRLMLDQLALNSNADVTALADEIDKAGLAGCVVVIDTLNQAAPGADENSSKDMGLLIQNAQLLQRRTGGLVLLVHHSGKDAGRGLRGHSSLYAALDGVIEVSKTTDSRQWKQDKVKDGKDGVTHAFKLEIVPLGLDEDGEAISSCVVVQALPPPAGTGKKEPQGEHQRAALRIIGGLLKASPDIGQGGAPALAPCIKESDAIAAVASGLVLSNPKRKRERAATAIRGLIDRGLIACGSEWLWPT